MTEFKNREVFKELASIALTNKGDNEGLRLLTDDSDLPQSYFEKTFAADMTPLGMMTLFRRQVELVFVACRKELPFKPVHVYITATSVNITQVSEEEFQTKFPFNWELFNIMQDIVGIYLSDEGLHYQHYVMQHDIKGTAKSFDDWFDTHLYWRRLQEQLGVTSPFRSAGEFRTVFVGNPLFSPVMVAGHAPPYDEIPPLFRTELEHKFYGTWFRYWDVYKRFVQLERKIHNEYALADSVKAVDR